MKKKYLSGFQNIWLLPPLPREKQFSQSPSFRWAAARITGGGVPGAENWSSLALKLVLSWLVVTFQPSTISCTDFFFLSVSIVNLYACTNEDMHVCLTQALPMILLGCGSLCERQNNWKGRCQPREAPGRAQLNSAPDKTTGLCMEALQLGSSLPPLSPHSLNTQTLPKAPPATKLWDN